MRKLFEEQLKSLGNELLNMSAMVEQAIEKSVDALASGDITGARDIMASDVVIDNERRKIQDMCFDLLLRQQPVASDLRLISAAMNMITDLERIGDHAADISEITIMISGTPYSGHLNYISHMATETMRMLLSAIQAFVDRDTEAARRVIDHDDVVDDLFLREKADIIRRIRTDSEGAEEAADLLMVAKYFERIGDHATNIAEWVIYAFQNGRM